MLDTLPEVHSSNQLDYDLRSNLLYALAQPLPLRWSGPNDLGFWEPSASDKPSPP